MNSKIAVAVGLAAVFAAIISLPQAVFAAEIKVNIQPNAASLGAKAFDPNPVEAHVGDTITWTNTDSTPHTATSGDASTATPDGTFGGTPDAGGTILVKGKSESWTADKEGEFPYFCTLHPQMTGKVVVTAATGGNGGNGGTGTPMDSKATATLDGKNYDVSAKSTSAKVTEATIQSGQSVTVKFDKAGEVELTLPKDMITGVNSVMAGTQELLNGDATVNADGSSTVKFTVPEGSTTVVIKGATVVPEFPMVALILAITMVAIIGYVRYAKSGTSFFGRV